MNFLNATACYFTKWLDFKSRISRSEFWWGYLGSIFVGILIGFFVGLFALILGISVELFNFAIYFVQIFFVIASLALVARRLHDINRSGWWQLISLTIIGVFVLIYWFCKKGDDNENRFGKNPLGSEVEEQLSRVESVM